MLRAGPLQELPLEHFLRAPPPSPSKTSRPNKRPHSPGGPILYSPAKRRVLDAEGVFSPEITMKSPVSSSALGGRFAPIHFDELLRGPDSPAKRLDFGSPKNSPQISSRSVGSDSAGRDLSQPLARPLSSRHSLDDDFDMGEYCNYPRSPSTTPPPSSFLSSTLQEPASINRHSVHYPGFDIFQDVEETPHHTPSLNEDFATTVSQLSQVEKDLEKENLPPRRKPQKSATEPIKPSDAAWVKAGLLSPSSKMSEVQQSGKAKTVPITPHPKRRVYVEKPRDGSLTPMSRSLRLLDSPTSILLDVTPGHLTPGRTPVGKSERMERRRALEDEVDDDDAEL